jgi:murein DD-endopeptidase MepM/ murein hydrolase activator NlpD
MKMGKNKILIAFFSYLEFFPDFIVYISLRLRQLFVWSGLIFEFLSILYTNLKKEVTRRMFWGRNSLYRQIFHFAIISITLITLLNGVSARIATVVNPVSDGINMSQGHIGNTDMILQYANARLFTVRGADDLPFEVYSYTVKEGDSLETIADEFGIDDISSIQWANGMDPYSKKIIVGQIIKIPPMKGVLKEAKKGDTAKTIIRGIKDANVIDVIELNNLTSVDDIIEEGRMIFIPNGSIPLRAPDANVKTGGSGNYIEIVNPGVNVPSGTFISPMGDPSCSGYGIARGYASHHTGYDFVKSGGCWIRSIGDGTVSYAQWNNGGLGFAVVINHADGFQSVYGHGNGTFAVKEGDFVQAGQKIMYMGNTGYSFGTHLHFSFSANNQSVLNCYRCRIPVEGIVPL